MKKKSVEMKDIVNRTRSKATNAAGFAITVVMRELSCGHQVAEPQGGRAKQATRAKCPLCAKLAEGAKVHAPTCDMGEDCSGCTP